jgi:adenine-specific DNA-methyltransferase
MYQDRAIDCFTHARNQCNGEHLTAHANVVPLYRRESSIRLVRPLGESFQRSRRLSYGQSGTGNILIQGENLSVLQNLHATYAGQVRCIYIDPPYNNQETYNHYGDVLTHDAWLYMMEPRLDALKGMLALNGSLWISIDDREVHYLKVCADRVLGQENFVTTIVWQQRTTRENRRVFSNNHEYILVYARDARRFKQTRNLLPAPHLAKRYKNPDNDPRGPWQSVSANVPAGHGTASQFYELTSPNGKRHKPPEGRCWAYTKKRMRAEMAARNVWFGKTGMGVPRLKQFLSSATLGITPETLWFASDVGTTDEAKKHLLQMFPDIPVFDTPKPEPLIARILEIASDKDDIVLDAFLGSGTTAAVAHKLGRRYVGIEQGEQAVTHCATRLRQVVNGETGGVSARVSWCGGGGFDFYMYRP